MRLALRTSSALLLAASFAVAAPANDLEGAIRVDPGKHVVEVEAPGRKPFSRTLEVAEKEQVSVDVVLVEQSAAKTEEKPKSKGPPLVTWIAAGASVALVGGGVGAYLVAGSKASAGADACRTAVACDDAQKSGVRALDGILRAMAWASSSCSSKGDFSARGVVRARQAVTNGPHWVSRHVSHAVTSADEPPQAGVSEQLGWQGPPTSQRQPMSRAYTSFEVA